MTRARTAAALWLAYGMTLVGACAPSVPGSIPEEPTPPAEEPPTPTEPPGGGEATCDPSVTCAAAGQPCQLPQQCCNGTCGPPGDAAPTCFECKPTGTPCSGPGDATCCFGTSCALAADASGYACAAVTPPGYSPPTCAWPGTKCASDGECCTGVCDKHKCAPCPPGVACEYEPMCIPPGEVCQFSEQCCGLPCMPDGAGTLRCLGCLADGTSCSAWSECCSRSCENGTCQVPRACGEIGQACTTNAVCCAGLVCALPPGATSGACAPTCTWSGGPCTADGDCCSGTCAVAAGETTGTCCAAAP